MAVMLRTRTEGGARLLNDPRNFIKIVCIPDTLDGEFVIEYDRNSESAATRWMSANGYDGSYIVTLVHDFDHSDEKNAGKLAVLARLVNEGFVLDVPELKGRIFQHLGQNASGKRTCTTMFMERGLGKKLINWYCLGQESNVFSRMPMEKVVIYLLQAFSSTKPWAQAFDSRTRDNMPEPNIRKVVLCKDVEFTRDLSKVAKVSFGKVSCTQAAVVETDNDGLSYLFVDSEEELEAFTGRMPFFKGLVVPISRKAVKEAFPNLRIIDKWGNSHDVDEVSMLWFESSFKGCKAWKSSDEFQSYKDKCAAAGIRMLVCKQGHPNARKRIPTQQMQAIMPSAEEERVLSWKGVADLHNVESVAGLIGMIPDRHERAVAKLMPAYLDEPIVKEAIQSAHIGKVRTVLSGCLPDGMNYVFAAPDTYPILCTVFGVEPKPVLKAGEVSLAHPLVPRGQKSVIMRNPCGTRGILVRENVQIPDNLKGLYMGTQCYFSTRDLSMRVLAMDYDGDTVGVFTVKSHGYSQAFYSALKRAWKVTGYRCVVFDNASPKTKYSSEAAKAETIRSEASKVGLVANAITRLIDLQSSTIDSMSDDEAAEMSQKLAILEAELTLIIDAAKNGGNSDIAATTEVANGIITDAVRKVAAPMHTFWKKRVTTEDIISCDYDLCKTADKFMEYRKDGTPKFVRRDNFMGRYTAAVEDDVVVKLPIEEFIARGEMDAWCPEGLQKRSAQWRAFCKVPPKNVVDFGFKGVRYNPDTHETQWDATFMGKVVGYLLSIRSQYTNHKLLCEKLADIVPAVRKRIFKVAAEKYGMDKDTTISTIVMRFYSMSHVSDRRNERILLKDIKDVIWLLFGEDILDNVKANLGVPQDFEIEPDTEEDEDKFAGFEPTDEELEAMAKAAGFDGFADEEGFSDD